jgi:predicted RNA methylase
MPKKVEIDKDKKPPMASMKITHKLDKLYNALNNLLDKKGNKRSRSQFIKEYGDDNISKEIFNIIEVQKYFDFFPTPKHCLMKLLEGSLFKTFSKILEGTAGLGSITHTAHQLNPDAEIVAVEMSKILAPLLKKLQPNIKVMNKNFLEIPVSTFNDVDCIILNPPFTNMGDKKFYLDFLFRGLNILNNSKVNGEKHLYFICPKLTGEDEKEDKIILMENIVKKMSKKKVIDIVKYNIPDIELKDNKIKPAMEDMDDEGAEEILETFGSEQIQFKGRCQGFGGTKITASMYLFIVY